MPVTRGLVSSSLRRKGILWALLVSPWVLTGCEDTTGPFERREERIGIIDHYGDSEGVIVAPETVPLAVSVEVLVRTYGGGCTAFGRTDVVDIDNGIQITPIDITGFPSEGFACPSILLRIDHRVSVAFDEPGPFRIVVRGRRLAPQDLDSGGEIILLEQAVQVTP